MRLPRGEAEVAGGHGITIGALVYHQVGQLDLTGPYEVLAHLPGAKVRLVGRTLEPVRDYQGLALIPDTTLDANERFDIILVPGGPGQQHLMDDETVLSWLRRATAEADHVLSVCTGALLLGAAGLLRGRRATTHWSAVDLLPLFGASATNARVVVDGSWVFAAGVTSGLDGALKLVELIAGAEAAQRIQLDIAYDPQPPFDAGTPARAASAVRTAAFEAGHDLHQRRYVFARAFAARHGISENAPAAQSA